VAQATSDWTINTDRGSYKPAYEGAVWIDRDNRRVLRLEMRATSMPLDFPLGSAEVMIEFALVKVDQGTFPLPDFGETVVCASRNGGCIRDSVQFRNYRKPVPAAR
jgi:hypothetical protein